MEFEELLALEESLENFESEEVEKVLDKITGVGFGTRLPAECWCSAWSESSGFRTLTQLKKHIET